MEPPDDHFASGGDQHFRRALELDPAYAPAHAALADCYNQLGTVMVGTGSLREYRPRAAAEAVRALQIDPVSSEAHAALGTCVTIVELRFFAGLTVEETAHVLNRSPRTIKREWRLAKAWLYRELRD